MSTPDLLAVAEQFIHCCTIETPTAFLCTAFLGRNHLFEDMPNILLFRKVTLCCCFPDASPQLRNEIDDESVCLVIIVLLHRHNCIYSLKLLVENGLLVCNDSYPLYDTMLSELRYGFK